LKQRPHVYRTVCDFYASSRCNVPIKIQRSTWPFVAHNSNMNKPEHGRRLLRQIQKTFGPNRTYNIVIYRLVFDEGRPIPILYFVAYTSVPMFPFSSTPFPRHLARIRFKQNRDGSILNFQIFFFTLKSCNRHSTNPFPVVLSSWNFAHSFV